MKLYLVTSEAPRREHIGEQIICAETPEAAFKLWCGFCCHGWPCHMNEIPAVSTAPQVMEWNPPDVFEETHWRDVSETFSQRITPRRSDRWSTRTGA